MSSMEVSRGSRLDSTSWSTHASGTNTTLNADSNSISDSSSSKERLGKSTSDKVSREAARWISERVPYSLEKKKLKPKASEVPPINFMSLFDSNDSGKDLEELLSPVDLAQKISQISWGAHFDLLIPAGQDMEYHVIAIVDIQKWRNSHLTCNDSGFHHAVRVAAELGKIVPFTRNSKKEIDRVYFDESSIKNEECEDKNCFGIGEVRFDHFKPSSDKPGPFGTINEFINFSIEKTDAKIRTYTTELYNSTIQQQYLEDLGFPADFYKVQEASKPKKAFKKGCCVIS